MASRSEVALVFKASLAKKVGEKFPFLANDADTIQENVFGDVLYYLVDVRWFGVTCVEALKKWLVEQEESDYRVIEASYDYPTNDSGDMGGWFDNPWGLS